MWAVITAHGINTHTQIILIHILNFQTEGIFYALTKIFHQRCNWLHKSCNCLSRSHLISIIRYRWVYLVFQHLRQSTVSTIRTLLKRKDFSLENGHVQQGFAVLRAVSQNLLAMSLKVRVPISLQSKLTMTHSPDRYREGTFPLTVLKQ